jgi:hypothetical protein
MAKQPKELTLPRTFNLYRPGKDVGHSPVPRSPTGAKVLEGCVFSDGCLVVRWMTNKHSTSIWSCLGDFLEVHGHPEYGTQLVWDDGEIQELA